MLSSLNFLTNGRAPSELWLVIYHHSHQWCKFLVVICVSNPWHMDQNHCFTAVYILYSYRSYICASNSTINIRTHFGFEAPISIKQVKWILLSLLWSGNLNIEFYLRLHILGLLKNGWFHKSWKRCNRPISFTNLALAKSNPPLQLKQIFLCFTISSADKDNIYHHNIFFILSVMHQTRH